MQINRDTVVAIVLLLICGILAQQSFEIREPGYGQMSPAVWPRAVVGVLSFLSLIYLVQSIRQGPDAHSGGPRGVVAFVGHWRNVLWCFALFLVYLLTMPVLGMLIGGSLFVFLLLSALGGWSPRLMALHAVIALVAIGGMWGLFTFGLKVFLPPGMILGRF
jgi:putative tricarboxylic transport membrane protein